jgi:hypothetical protein
LHLAKDEQEMLASLMHRDKLLGPDCRVTASRSRNALLARQFTESGKLTYCHNVSTLFIALGYNMMPDQWRLFIDSSKRSLKAVLLSNGMNLPSVPIAYSQYLNETYDNLAQVINCVNYQNYGWQVIK